MSNKRVLFKSIPLNILVLQIDNKVLSKVISWLSNVQVIPMSSAQLDPSSGQKTFQVLLISMGVADHALLKGEKKHLVFVFRGRVEVSFVYFFQSVQKSK